jgi:hypothetical protein
MKELKSKKTGVTKVYTEEEYADIVNNKPDMLKRFEVTDIKSRPIIPSLKEVPKEIKIIKKTKE